VSRGVLLTVSGYGLRLGFGVNFGLVKVSLVLARVDYFSI